MKNITATIKTAPGETFADAVKRTLNASHVMIAATGISVKRPGEYLGVDLPKAFWPIAMGGEGRAIPPVIKLRFEVER